MIRDSKDYCNIEEVLIYEFLDFVYCGTCCKFGGLL